MTMLRLKRRSGGLGLSPRRRRAKAAPPPDAVQGGLVAEGRFGGRAGQSPADHEGGFHGAVGSTTGVDAPDRLWTGGGAEILDPLSADREPEPKVGARRP
jgi:hypothetical protein